MVFISISFLKAERNIAPELLLCGDGRASGSRRLVSAGRGPRRTHLVPTALDNGQRSPRKLLRAVVARLLGCSGGSPKASGGTIQVALALALQRRQSRTPPIAAGCRSTPARRRRERVLEGERS